MVFKTAINGYDRKQVDDTVDSYKATIESLKRQIGQLEGEKMTFKSSVQALKQRTESAERNLAVAKTNYDNLTKQATNTVNALRTQLADYKKRAESAQEGADKPWASAGEEAQRLVNAAGRHASAIVDEAQQQAEKITSDARTEAERMMAEARAEAEKQHQLAADALSRVKELSAKVGEVHEILEAIEGDRADSAPVAVDVPDQPSHKTELASGTEKNAPLPLPEASNLQAPPKRQ